MPYQSKRAARRFGNIHEVIWQTMQATSFSVNEVASRIYHKRTVHPQQLKRCRKVLDLYIKAGLLTRPNSLNSVYEVRMVDPDDVQLDIRERLEALREKNNKKYSFQRSFFDGLLDEELD